MRRHSPWLLAVVVLGAGLAFVYLGPELSFSIAARAVIASIIYRLIRRAL